MERHALLVGIQGYPRLPPEQRLQGSINDAREMERLLRDRYGFSQEHITLLLDAEATRAGILGALDALVERAGEGDTIVVFYAGHGTQVPDTDGDEPDGLDEALAPYEWDRSAARSSVITDDEIQERVLRLSEKTPYLTVIFDCCHSGSALRGALEDRVRSVDADLPPAVATLAARGASASVTPPVAPPRPTSRWTLDPDRYAFVGACMDGERAHEVKIHEEDPDTQKHGELSRFLVEELWRAPLGTSLREIFQAARRRISSVHPQAEGALDRAAFGVSDAAAVPTAPIVKLAGTDVVIGAGLLHGVSEGAVWAVEQRLEGSAERVERARIDIACVQGTTAKGKVRVPPGALVPELRVGDRAMEVARGEVLAAPPGGAHLLAVDLQVPESFSTRAADLEKALRASPGVALAGKGPDRVSVRALGSRAAAGEPLPQLGALERDVWVVEREGRLLLPTVPIDAEGAVTKVRDGLEKLARRASLERLENPPPESLPMGGPIAIQVLVKGPSGDWVAAASGGGMDGRISLEEGTRVALEVQNGSAENLYMGLVNIDMSGAVLLAPPLAGAAEAVSAGRTLRIGAARGIELKIPAGYPPDPADRQEGGGETLLLLASTMPTDFQVLVQQRDAVPPGKLAALFRAAFHLQPERAATFLPKGPAAVERWAVARVHYRLRPRPSL